MNSAKTSGAESWNVLLLDDESMVLQVHGQMVSRLGHVATMFNCPFHALEYVQERRDQFDLIISDYRMPELNGLEFISRIREGGCEVPVLLLTGYASELDLKKAASHNVVVIEKPVRMRELAGCMDALRARLQAGEAA